MMPEMHLFEYATIRLMPRVEREEFLNIGVILFCKRLKFLECRYIIDGHKFQCIAPSLDMDEIEKYLISFNNICIGNTESGRIGQLDHADRFRWLTSSRSTVIQCSKVHPGMCKDAGAILTRLFQEQAG